MKSLHKQAGFTLIELMIAITVLAMVLLLTTIGIVRIGQGYYRGITQANTQQAARTVLNDLTQSIQFSGFAAVLSGTPPTSFSHNGVLNVGTTCIGLQRYSYALGFQQTSTTDVASSTSIHTLWKDNLADPTCTTIDVGLAAPSAVGSELLGSKMRLTNFSITSTDNTFYTLGVTVMYGDDDLIDMGPAGTPMKDWKCKPSLGLIGAAFCAKSELSTTVGKRLS